jgi:hypothetical protein
MRSLTGITRLIYSRRDEQVKFRVLVNSKEKVRGKKSLVYFARANLDLPKR